MEFGERLASPSSSPSTFHMAFSSASSSPTPNQPTSIKSSSLAPSPAGSSPLTTCANLGNATKDELLNSPSSSKGFPVVSPPAFGLYTSGSGRSEFGGLGSLGLSALAAHSQYGALPDWWRSSEAHTIGAATFLPPLMGLHPIFASTFKSHDPAHLKSYTPGLTGTGNGSSVFSTGNIAANRSFFQTKGKIEKTEANVGWSQNRSQGKQQRHQKSIHINIEKKPNESPQETCSMSGSQSGSLSDSSSNGVESSSDPDDMEEEDIDEEEYDQSNDGEDSNSVKDGFEEQKVKRLTLNPSETKKKRPSSTDGNATQDRHCDNVPLTSLYRLHSKTAEDEGQQHTSVIQAIGLAATNIPLTHTHREASLLSRSSTESISFSSFSLPKSPSLFASQKPRHKPQFLMPCPKHTELVDDMKESSGSLLDGRSLHLNSFTLKQPNRSKESGNQALPLQPKSHNCNRVNHSADQETPLALITRPRSQSSTPKNKTLLAASSHPFPMPINLSRGIKEISATSASPLKYSSASSSVSDTSSTTQSPISLCAVKRLPKDNTSYTPLDLVRSSESGNNSSKDSDSYGDEDEEDDMGDDDSSSSLSESESNAKSDSDGSEDDAKEHGEKEADSDTKRTPLKCAKSPSSIHKFSSHVSSGCSLLDLQIIKPPGLSSNILPGTTVTSLGAPCNHSTLTPSFTFATLPGSRKRRRVTDERVLRLPLEFGWQRETRIRKVAGRLQGEVAYLTPCGKKLRQYPDVMKYLIRHGITDITRDNFSFSTKIKVGDFYEAMEGPKGLQWGLLAEEEIAPRIVAMDGRRSRCSKSEHQSVGVGAASRQWKSHPINMSENKLQDVSDAKLLRKLEAQEIARQATQIKMMRKLEKQAMAQAAREARRQQAIMAAEERREKKEQMKILKQQDKIKRIQQIRMQKELRAQQILEAKRKKKEEVANAKILETEKRNKEKEMRRLQAVILKRHELERHRLDMVWEKERRKQHMMLMKAVEARKKAEEKERLKKEKKDEKRLNKERKLELKRLELEKAKELKMTNEDMCIGDQKPLAELSQLPGLILPASTVSDCLMVLQFLRRFGKVLRLDLNPDILNLSELQEGLLNIGDSKGKVQDLLVSVLSAAVCDPGLPAGQKNKTALGDHLTNVEINRNNVSEILQIYMNGHCEQTEQASLAFSLRTKAFQAHNPSEKASMLAFLVNELCCSKAVIGEIDKNIDHMTNLRKDKWAVDGKLRKLRSIHTKKMGKRESSVGGDNGHIFAVPSVRNKSKRKEGDSEEEEDEEDDSEDQGDDDDEEEEESGGKKVKKAEICEEEDDCVHLASMEELEKLIEKTDKQQSQIRQKLFDSSQFLRSVTIGQDRFKRRYWLLPQCGGIFVEGLESSEGREEVEKERKRQKTTQLSRVKEEQVEETVRPLVYNPEPSTDTGTNAQEPQHYKDSLNLFLQKPDSFAKLSKLLVGANVAQDTDINSHNNHPTKLPTSASYPSYFARQTAACQQGLPDKTDSSVPSPLKGYPWKTCSPQSVLHEDQLSKMLMERSNQWFSLFPRSPCDESSVTAGSRSRTSSPPPQAISTKHPTSHSLDLAATVNPSFPAGISNMQSFVFKDLDSQYTQDKGSGVFFLASNNSSNKSETPEPQSNKPSASSPAADVAKPQDFSCPQPIPEEMLSGWWRVSNIEELLHLVKTLQARGIREKVLQKQIQKNMECMAELYANSKNGILMAKLEGQQVSEETVESWCVEDQAMEDDISKLQQVEELERKVSSASLQVKGWMHPEPQSERDDLVYHEHKFFSSCSPETKAQRETSQEETPGTVVRRPNNPLDIAVIRLAELERNIERNDEVEAAPGMRLWRKALREVRSSAQLSLCIQQLQKSISWDRSVVKVHCQLCQKGNNEELLLLCDRCDKGCHTYCHKPKITTVPDGDWFCPSCVEKVSGQSPHSRRQQSQPGGGGKKGSEIKSKGKPSALGVPPREEASGCNSAPKKGTKEFRKRKGDDSPHRSQASHDSTVSVSKKGKTLKDDNNGLEMCRMLLAELEAHQDAWPFLTPVNHKAVPGYRKVIRKPMDLSTIREKLINNQYSNIDTFIFDVNLVFENCERFNEDYSDIGRAGHRMRSFFDKRWAELLKQRI